MHCLYSSLCIMYTRLFLILWDINILELVLVHSNNL